VGSVSKDPFNPGASCVHEAGDERLETPYIGLVALGQETGEGERGVALALK